MKNVNFDFLLDIWAELKAKRLAPVAVGLLVALVAMPAVLLKGEGAPEDAPLPVMAAPASSGPKVEVSEELASRGSKLDSYAARDPFKGKVKPKADEGFGKGGTASVPGLGGKPDKQIELPPLGGGSGGSSGSTGSTGSGGSNKPLAPVTPPSSIEKPKLQRYNYQLNLKFGHPGREKRYRGVTRMTFLPRPNFPVLLFMGVPVDERSAIFFVYPGLTHQGEGECIPSPRECNFLKLGVGKQHYLSAKDFEYRLELLKVRRVRLSEERAERENTRKAASGRRSGRTTGEGTSEVSGTTGDPAKFEFPWLVDGIG